MEEITIATRVGLSLILGAFFVLFLRVFDASFLKPRRLRSKIEKHGIKGPVPSLLYGNIPEMKRIIQLQKPMDKKSPEKLLHAWFSFVFPHLEQWRNEYGECMSDVCF